LQKIVTQKAALPGTPGAAFSLPKPSFGKEKFSKTESFLGNAR
jgi:hypothetical protein